MGMFRFSQEIFPIVVDYKVPIGEAWSAALKHVVEWGNIDLKGREFPLVSAEKREFPCSYAVLEKDDHLWNMEDIFSENDIFPADMMQLFAFICAHVKAEVTIDKATPIVAAASGSTWRCSHDILYEMAGVYWSTWYHNPGPSLGTISASPNNGFEKGTRFLMVKR